MQKIDAMTNPLRLILSLLFLCNFLGWLLGQQPITTVPRMVDGQVIACEKLEMMEKYFELVQQNADPSLPPLDKPTYQHRSNHAEVMVSNGGEAESEIHAVVNPLDSNNIVVAVMNLQSDNPLEFIDVSVYVTMDGGETWSPSLFNYQGLGIITVAGGDPLLAFDSFGTLYITYLLVERTASQLNWGLYTQMSNDGGLTWNNNNEPDFLSVANDLDFLSDLDIVADKQWMGADLCDSSPYIGNVYMCYTLLNLDENSYSIAFRRKPSFLNRFETRELVISQVVTNGIVQFSNLEVDSEGNIYVLYLVNLQGRRNVHTAFMTTSTDGGESFSEPVVVTDIFYPDFGSSDLPIPGMNDMRKYPCPQIAIDRSGLEYNNRLYFTYTGFGLAARSSETTDVYLMSSDDGGQTWSLPAKVHDDGALDVNQFYSSITVTEAGRLGLAWYDRRDYDRTSTLTDYFLGFSDDGGETITNVKVSGQSSDFEFIGDRNASFGIGEYNEIVSSGNKLIPVWSDGRANDGSVAVYAYLFDSVDVVSSVGSPTVQINTDVFIESLSPNPVHDSFDIKLSSNKAKTINVSVINSDGIKVLELLSSYNLIRSETIQIDNHNLSSGQYYLSVAWDKGKVVKKFIVQN